MLSNTRCQILESIGRWQYSCKISPPHAHAHWVLFYPQAVGVLSVARKTPYFLQSLRPFFVECRLFSKIFIPHLLTSRCPEHRMPDMISCRSYLIWLGNHKDNELAVFSILLYKLANAIRGWNWILNDVSHSSLHRILSAEWVSCLRPRLICFLYSMICTWYDLHMVREYKVRKLFRVRQLEVRELSVGSTRIVWSTMLFS